MNQRSLIEACEIWDMTNERAEWLVDGSGAPSLRLKYEDFAVAPRESIDKILKLIGEPRANPTFVDDRHVRLTPEHTISGNPSKFDHDGIVDIRLDDEWKTKMSPEDIAYATQATLPRLQAYGYEPTPT